MQQTVQTQQQFTQSQQPAPPSPKYNWIIIQGCLSKISAQERRQGIDWSAIK